MNHPLQPLAKDEHGTLRFKRNTIVDFLVKRFGLNELAAMDFPQEDWEQLAQLIGYSLSGFGDLSYVRTETWETACALRDNEGMSQDQARIAVLEEKLREVRNAFRAAVPILFQTHPDDLRD